MEKNNSNPRTVFTQFRLVDSKWICVNTNMPDLASVVLADYLAELGVYIPDNIDYCLAHTPTHTHNVKYRVFGGSINIYVSPSN